MEDDFERRWKMMKQALLADAQGEAPKPLVSQRTLFGIKSSVEQTIERAVAEDEAQRRRRREESKMPEFRLAQPGDGELVLDLVSQLAVYEHALERVEATADMFEHWLFEDRRCEVIFVLDEGREVGMALFFSTFSTWLGKPGIHLEDLFVLPEFRGKGYGKALLKKLAQVTLDRGYGRLEWQCLDWNEPSLGFYRTMGAETLDEWVDLRLEGESLRKVADL